MATVQYSYLTKRLLVTATLTLASSVRAQTAERTGSFSWSLETIAAAYQTSHPEQGPIGVGVGLGVEHPIGRRSATRLSVRALKTISIGDDIALCHLLPDGSCLPDSVFPASLWMADIVLTTRPLRSLPVSILAGAGIALPLGSPVGDGASEDPGARADHGASWQLGLETALGRSQRAPRLQVSRLALLRGMLSLDGTIAIIMRFPLR